MATTSKSFVWPYKSTTSRMERRPSLHVVCTWKSQSRNGSYPGTSDPYVNVVAIRRTMPENLRPEIAHVERKDGPLPHRVIAARGRPDPAIAGELHATTRREPAAEIGVFAV